MAELGFQRAIRRRAILDVIRFVLRAVIAGLVILRLDALVGPVVSLFEAIYAFLPRAERQFVRRRAMWLRSHLHRPQKRGLPEVRHVAHVVRRGREAAFRVASAGVRADDGGEVAARKRECVGRRGSRIGFWVSIRRDRTGRAACWIGLGSTRIQRSVAVSTVVGIFRHRRVLEGNFVPENNTKGETQLTQLG